MRWLLHFSVHHSRAVLIIVAAFVLAACFFIPRVKLQLDARSLIPTNDPGLIESDKAARLFGLRDVVVIGVANESSGIYTPETLSRVARLSKELGQVEGIVPSSVLSVATMPRLLIQDNRIDSRPLFPPNVKLDAEAVARIRRETERMGLNNGVLVASDGRAAAVFGEVQPEADRYAVLRQVRELVEREKGGSDAIYLSGTALAQAILGESAARDLMRLVPLVIVVLGIFLMLAFRHPVPALISLAEIGCSLIFTVGLVGLSGQSVFVTTMVLPVILIAVGVSDDVYALRHYFVEAQQNPHRSLEENVEAAFGSVFRPIALTSATTVVGLMSLAATSLEPLRIFGIFGAVAIVFSSLFTFTLVPALLVLLNPKLSMSETGEGLRGTREMSVMFRLLSATGPRVILGVALLGVVGASWLTTRLRVDDSWVKNLPAESDIFQGDKSLNTLLGGTTTLNFLLDGARPDGLLRPQTIAALGATEDAIAKLPFVGAVHSIYSDIVRVNASLRGMDYAAYRNELRHGRLMLSQDEIEQSLLLLESMRRDPLDTWIDTGYQRARILVFIRFADYARIDNVIEAASGAGIHLSGTNQAITPFGDGWISYLTVRLLVEGQLRSILLALLVDLVLLSLLLKSVVHGFIAILPVAFSVVIVFAALVITGTPLGIANSMFASIAIGIGLDFSIHLTAAYQFGLARGALPVDSMRRAFVGTGSSIIVSAGAITLGFLVLALSEVAPNVQLGLMICLSLAVCAITTLVLVPSLALIRRSPTCA